MVGDLHCHSHYSDGAADIDTLVKMAREIGLSHLAVTDHETFDGYEYAVEFAKGTNLQIVKGIEISSINPENGRFVHILCYNPQDDTPIENLTAATRKARTASGFVMARRLMELYPVHMAEIYSNAKNSRCLYKTHMMKCLIDRDYTDSYYGDLFRKLFARSGLCFEPIDYPPVEDALRAARESGGHVVLAHPSVYGSIELCGQLVKAGQLDGIEVDHPRNTPQHKDHLRRLALEHNLIITGGTDYHGHKPGKNHPLGTGKTVGDNMERILQKKER